MITLSREERRSLSRRILVKLLKKTQKQSEKLRFCNGISKKQILSALGLLSRPFETVEVSTLGHTSKQKHAGLFDAFVAILQTVADEAKLITFKIKAKRKNQNPNGVAKGHETV